MSRLETEPNCTAQTGQVASASMYAEVWLSTLCFFRTCESSAFCVARASPQVLQRKAAHAAAEAPPPPPTRRRGVGSSMGDDT